MKQEDVDEVWRSLDLDLLQDLARRGPEPVFATISGAHLYGFASPDSDVDLRGAYLLSAREVLGLGPCRDTISVVDKTRLDLDWVAHDLRKFARMMIAHNGYVLEQLFSPLVVLSSPAHEELRELGEGCATRPTVRHYLGFAHGRRRSLAAPGRTVKHLLYAYRVYLTGIHLMHTGEFVSHLPTLNQLFRSSRVDELIERKREGAEKMYLGEEELARNESELDRLEGMLREAHQRSSLPEEATTARAIEDLVVRLRIA